MSLVLSKLLKLPPDKRAAVIESLSHDEALNLIYNWEFWGRDKQKEPPGDWIKWLLLAGRGFGKSRTGAEFIRKKVETGKASRIALVAPTAADARDIMVEGESGILAISPPWFMPEYEPSKRRITWPNGAIATTFSADEPERLRGPNHDLAWVDELCSWRYPEAFDMLMFGLRLGVDPKVIITTTPKPIKILKEIMQDKNTYITTGSTYENKKNLAKSFMNEIISKYQGTRLGRQELMAEILSDAPGALWKRDDIEENKVSEPPELKSIVVAIDPAVTSKKTSDETGIIVAGLGVDHHGYILDDLSCRAKPNEWAKIAIEAYHKYSANKIVAEVNNGGDMIAYTLGTIDKNVPIRQVHAARGKATRAEPISALYEQGKVHHVGNLPQLEDQMCSWIPGMGSSPDRIDALTWSLFDLIINNTKTQINIGPIGTAKKSAWRV